MTSAEMLTTGRAMAESLMRFTCQATVPSTGQGGLDGTGWPTNPAGTVIYTGKCRFRMGGTVSGSSSRDVAEDRVFTSQPILSVPVTAAALPVGAVVKITAVPADDPGAHLWLDMRMRVVGRVLGGDMTAQRVTVEVVTG